MPTNCVNCGAPLTGSKCQYCGTRYKCDNVVAYFGKDDWTGTLSIGGKEYSVYLGDMECAAIRDCIMHGDIIGHKRKFTLIEM